MAKRRNPPRKQTKENPKNQTNQKKNPHLQQEKPHSWAVVKSLFSCKHLQTQMQYHQQQQQQHQEGEQKDRKQEQVGIEERNTLCKKMKCSGSLCSNTKVMHKPESVSPENLKKMASSSTILGSLNNENVSCRSIKVTVKGLNGAVGSTSSPFSSSGSISAGSTTPPSIAGSFRGGILPFRKLSGCYECRMVVDPVLAMTRDPSLRSTICSCPECGEIFMKAENLELHQSVRHAVSELGPEDTSKNIVEIIFQSSWLKKQASICKIDRILKVHNTSTTISRFEDYRDAIKAKATKFSKKHPRCVADGNELLRFHCTTLMCSLGLNRSSNLCNSIPSCNVCSIIKNGFKVPGDVAGKGILTTATSGKAHDNADVGAGDADKRAMLVCRVIGGRVKRSTTEERLEEEYDSVAGATGVYSNLDELYVGNPKAILPCFVVIYRGF